MIWLLNIAYMTLGEHPDRVPRQYLLPAQSFRSTAEVAPFENVALKAGLGVRGPNLAGGSVFDDFNGDNLPDLFTTSLDAELGATLLINRGNGTFDDRSAAAGLTDQVYALNVTRTDFDNDGDLDVLLLRGAWEMPLRMSLLRNDGARFTDVTAASGLAEPIASESAAWGDYDNDGFVDVFVCGEFLPPGGPAAQTQGDPRNRCRLYHNQHDGTFKNVAEAAGVTNLRCGKGSAWGDYDRDGLIDLFVSNMGQPCRLYRNLGEGKFKDVAPDLGVTGADLSFACWFWDYDNDGLLDIYVNDYRTRVGEVLASAMGLKIPGLEPAPALSQPGRRWVPRRVAGCRAGPGDGPHGCELRRLRQRRLPRLLPGNRRHVVRRPRFESALQECRWIPVRRCHHQLGNRPSSEGTRSLVCRLGWRRRSRPFRRAGGCDSRRPGLQRTVPEPRLRPRVAQGETDRKAVQPDGSGGEDQGRFESADGIGRSIYRTIGNNSSFGGNTLVETFGLLDSKRVTELTVSWPTSRTTQTFRDIAAGQTIEIEEGSAAYKVLPRPKP